MRKIGVIGFGGRLGDLIQNVLLELGMDVKIAAVADTDLTAVRGRLRHPGLTADGIRFYTDAREMLDNEELDGCMIGTRCNTHTPYAVEVLRRNIPLFLEKPVSVTMEQLRALDAAGKATAAQTVVSFPLRASLPVRKAKAIIDMYDTPDILRCYTDRAIDDVLCEYIGIQQREFAYKPVRKMRVGQDAIAIKRHITKSETQPEVQADDGVTAKKIQNVYVYCQYITRIS